MCFIVVCALIDNDYASLLFSQTLFSYCFCMVSKFAKGFERKVWRVQIAHSHNTARALSSLSRCFQLWTNLDRYISDLGLCINWHVFLPIRLQKLLIVYYYSENRTTSRFWKVLPNMFFFPQIWGEKMATLWACACKLSWTLFSPARVQPLYGARRKESSGTGLLCNRFLHRRKPSGISTSFPGFLASLLWAEQE